MASTMIALKRNILRPTIENSLLEPAPIDAIVKRLRHDDVSSVGTSDDTRIVVAVRFFEQFFSWSHAGAQVFDSFLERPELPELQVSARKIHWHPCALFFVRAVY